MLRRTFKYRLYPSRRQERLLLEQLRFTRDLYNAGLEQRIIAYRVTGRSPSYAEQSHELTNLRREFPAWLPDGMSRSAQQYSLRRLDLAFQGFFRRLKAGQKPGFRALRARIVGTRSSASMEKAPGFATIFSGFTGRASAT